MTDCMFAIPHELTGIGTTCGLFHGQNGVQRLWQGLRGISRPHRRIAQGPCQRDCRKAQRGTVK